MKNKLALLLLVSILFNSAFLGCEEEEEDETATMCYVISGNTLTLNCYTDRISTCEEDNKISLAKYSDWGTCAGDFDAVLSNWQNTGSISPGPNSLSSGGGGTTKNCDNDSKVVYYRNLLNQGCQPCANCAILAFVKCNEPNNTQLINLYRAAVQQDVISYGVQTCPEL